MRIVTICLIALLTGCGPLVPVIKVDEQQANALEREISVRRVGADNTLSGDRLGPITAFSCRNNLWDPPATEANAINQLRSLARDRGANAVVEVSCDPAEGVSLKKNCWSAVACRGIALKASQ